MNILLTAINAKYIHTNLANRYICKYAAERGLHIQICEFTINQHIDFIISSIYEKKPEILGFSCYIWNIEIIKSIVSDIKKIIPSVVIVLGGPEVGFNALDSLVEIRQADYVVSGAGEKSFYELVLAIINGEDHISIRGVTGRAALNNTTELPNNRNEDEFDINDTVFPYSHRDIDELYGRIIYYETQRGCPFNCSYCLSSVTLGVKYLNMERVLNELAFFINKRIKLVKLVDRTFNSSMERRLKIWGFLINNDNGITCFHFEICAQLLCEEDFILLKKARNGLFQFEIGVQSTFSKTLSAINRKSDIEVLSENVKRLKDIGNIHLHLDLIAGLPYESLDDFKTSFNYVFSLKPEALQLGFLKVLKGCALREQAPEYKLLYSERSPYEILSTAVLSFSDIIKLKNVERILNFYYNSSLAIKTIEYLLSFINPFDFFNNLSEYWKRNGYFGINHSKMKLFEILFSFINTEFSAHGFKLDVVKDTFVFDILINDNIKTMPEWIFRKQRSEDELAKGVYKDESLLFNLCPELLKFSYKQLLKQCNVVVFNYDIFLNFSKRETVVLFHYLSGKGTAHMLQIKEGDANAQN